MYNELIFSFEEEVIVSSQDILVFFVFDESTNIKMCEVISNITAF